MTGSSSKLLSSEIATALRGRTLSFFLYPFSFREFLIYHHIALDNVSVYSSQRYQIKKLFNEFFCFGGLPEVFKLPKGFKIKYLQEYINLVIYYDLIERYRIKNIGFLKEYTRHLINETSNFFSLTGFYRTIKQLGMNVSKDILFLYLSYLEDAHSIITSSIFSKSYKKRLVNPKKVYCLDQGLYQAINFEQEKGKILETIAFISPRVSL